jgi:MFS transporter, SP family, solute carrier family 2 (myo-inositol transporter), member 13
LRDNKNVDAEVQDILGSVAIGEDNLQMTFSEILNKLRESTTARALFVGCSLQAAQQLCGINTVMYYTATILSFAGFGSDLVVLLWLSAVASFCNFIGSCGGLYSVDRYGRRSLTLYSIFGVSICLSLLSISFYFAEVMSPKASSSSLEGGCSQYSYCFDCIQDDNCGWCEAIPYPSGHNSGCIPADDDHNPVNSTYCPISSDFYPSSCPGNGQSFGWLIFISLCLYLLVFSAGMGCMPWTITSEIFPTNVRGVCNSITTTTNWSMNLLVSLTFLTITNTCTKQSAFGIYAGIALIFLWFFFNYLPETKGLSLEEIQSLFSDTLWGHPRKARRNNMYNKFMIVQTSDDDHDLVTALR